ncbi:MAG TPA: alpha/beta hydrolase [Rectinemataceae bacterium]|nr:alpha/beta hydrolase [Rectinemataceae bacterium]
MDGSYVEVEGTTWFYLDNGPGRLFLYVHGNTGSSTWWERVMDIPGCRCVAPDLPNFGRSDALVGELSIDAYADALASFVVALGLEGAIVVGHSLGGAVAMSLVVRHTELVGGLVLVDSSSPRGLVTLEAHYPAIELMRTDTKILAQALKAVVPTLSDDSYFERLVADASKMRFPAWVGNARALSHFDVSHEIGKWKLPTLVVWGRKDPIITQAMAEETASAFPLGQLEILEGVGHSVVVEDPARFKGLLLQYLAGLE